VTFRVTFDSSPAVRRRQCRFGPAADSQNRWIATCRTEEIFEKALFWLRRVTFRVTLLPHHPPE
jgi:hypothetical protein